MHIMKGQLEEARSVEQPADRRLQYTLVMLLPGWESMECAYIYNDIQPKMPAFVDFQGDWYEVPGSVTSLFLALAEYPNASRAIDGNDQSFLKKYGWTPYLLINDFEVCLPEKFVHSPGEFPTVLYWAYNGHSTT